MLRADQCFDGVDFLPFVSLQNITISGNIYRGIRNLLESCQVPELIKVQSLTSSLSLSDIVQLSQCSISLNVVSQNCQTIESHLKKSRQNSQHDQIEDVFVLLMFVRMWLLWWTPKTECPMALWHLVPVPL